MMREIISDPGVAEYVYRTSRQRVLVWPLTHVDSVGKRRALQSGGYRAPARRYLRLQHRQEARLRVTEGNGEWRGTGQAREAAALDVGKRRSRRARRRHRH